MNGLMCWRVCNLAFGFGKVPKLDGERKRMGSEAIILSVSLPSYVSRQYFNSELYISEQWYPKTALPDLLGIPADRVDDNRLYRGLDALLPTKESLKVHLKNRLGELFNIEYDLLL